jgi:hypothetical protein
MEEPQGDGRSSTGELHGEPMKRSSTGDGKPPAGGATHERRAPAEEQAGTARRWRRRILDLYMLVRANGREKTRNRRR